MRQIGPSHKRRVPKPDRAKSALSAQELHAYYIALISSRRLSVSDSELKAS